MIGDRRKRRPSGHARADRVNSEPTRVVPQFECAAAANTTKVSAGATQMSLADPWKIQAQAMLLNSHELSSAEWRSRPVVRALRRVERLLLWLLKPPPTRSGYVRMNPDGRLRDYPTSWCASPAAGAPV